MPNEKKPKKQDVKPRTESKYAPPPPDNQVFSSVKQAVSNPMYSAPAGGGGVGVTGNTVLGTRFGAYAELLRQRITQAWQRNGLDARSQRDPAIISLTIMQNGSVRDIRLVQTSGNPAIDNSALRALYQANPLPPLPAGLGSFVRDPIQLRPKINETASLSLICTDSRGPLALGSHWSASAQQQPTIPIEGSGQVPNVAVTDFRASGAAQPFMAAFNATVLADLQGSPLVKVVPKTLYPVAVPADGHRSSSGPSCSRTNSGWSSLDGLESSSDQRKLPGIRLCR